MSEQEIKVDEKDTYENEDVKTLQEMEARYNAELAKRDAKYSALLKYATESGRVSTETQEPEETPEEKWAKNCNIIQNSTKYDNLTIGKALLEGDQYYREKYGKSIFVSESGTLDSKEEKIADTASEILQYGIDNSFDNSLSFTNAFTSRLVEN